MDNIIFSVFTPVYNSKHTLHRVWQSLMDQTFTKFEWIVVDDGSTDNVGVLLEEYKKTVPFKMTVLVQDNSGKHIAWNRAVEIAKGEFFVPADADDSFLPETLETFQFYWNTIRDEDKVLFSGVNVLCKYPENNNIVGDMFPTSPMISNNLELVYKYKIKGEKWGFVKTSVLKEFPFPEIKGKGSYFLGYLWYSIGRKYKNLSINIALRFYYQDSGIQITKVHSKKSKYSAPIYYDYFVWDLNTNLDYKFKYLHFRSIIFGFINLWCLGLSIDKSISKVINKMKGISKVLIICFFIPGILLYHIKVKNYK